jgi:hypothetical protein
MGEVVAIALVTGPDELSPSGLYDAGPIAERSNGGGA